ncbi:MAG: hypothetical protein QNJ63_05630 [Calothrix sp. MO_192.B10]|nr:hypothetical protein [Calothrix sp. MO_192.B10]
MLQAIVDRGKNSHYQLINHCHKVAQARLLQAKILKEKLENTGVAEYRDELIYRGTI